MRRLLTLPLSYLVISEALVVAALGFAGWHLLERIRTPTPAVGVVTMTPPPTHIRAATSSPSPPAAAPAPPKPSPSSSASKLAAATEPAYWAPRLDRLNTDQAQLQQLQWQVILAVKVAAERYLKDVVLTAVAAAQRSHPIATPSPRAPP